jgi:Ca2+-binding EF-hand superfamily protein
MNRKLLTIIVSVAVIAAIGTIYFIRSTINKKINDEKSTVVALMDKNGDNILSRDEFPAEISKEFNSLDKDKDGKVTSKDISSSKSPINVNIAFDKLDKNRDGVLNSNECPEKMKEQYKNIDTNNDGKLTKDEIKYVKNEATNIDWFANIDKNGDGVITFIESPKNFRRDFCVADINNDRKITKTEFNIVLSMAKDSDLFGIYDINGDGVLTVDEYPDKMKNNSSETDTNSDGKLTKEEIINRENKQ